MDEPIIELAGLTKKYGSFTAVDHLDLSVSRGEVFGLLGPNGAGKSTTILMMIGLTEPSSGSVRVCGVDSTSKPVEVKRRVGYLPEDVGFYQEFSGLENLVYTARLNGVPELEAARKAEQMLEKVGLSGQGKKKTGTYSRGMRQRLGLADVLIKSPQVIILDEPTLGLDPEGVREFLSLIRQLSKDEGLTVLLSSHHLHQVQQICDRVGIFVGGRLIAEGDISKLSGELFAGEAFVVEVGVAAGESGSVGKKRSAEAVADSASGDDSASGKSPASWRKTSAGSLRQRLKENLEQLEGVTAVNDEGDLFRISCSRDLTSEIAREVLASGADLTSLQRKEYGLDDIYHRYFQGGKEK